MAIADEWDDVNEALDRLEFYRALHPTLVAIGKLVDMIKHDPAFADLHPSVSMASIILSRDLAKRRVCVGWKEDGGYDVAFVDPMMEFSQATMVGEDDVVRVLRDYLDRL
jgi:hypothetical protein